MSVNMQEINLKFRIMGRTTEGAKKDICRTFAYRETDSRKKCKRDNGYNFAIGHGLIA